MVAYDFFSFDSATIWWALALWGLLSRDLKVHEPCSAILDVDECYTVEIQYSRHMTHGLVLSQLFTLEASRMSIVLFSIVNQSISVRQVRYEAQGKWQVPKGNTRRLCITIVRPVTRSRSRISTHSLMSATLLRFNTGGIWHLGIWHLGFFFLDSGSGLRLVTLV